MKPMMAGKLRHRVDIQERTTAQDGHGNPVDSWSTVATVWASVEPVSGGEVAVAEKVTAHVTHKVTVRSRTFTPRSRIVHRGRAFDVNDVLNTEECGRECVCLCTEAV